MLDLGAGILAVLEAAFSFWNNMINLAFSLLSVSPDEFKNGNPWQVVERINPLFVAVGSSLVVLFFVIGFCSESVEIREEMRFEMILRMLIRIGFAEWLVTNNLPIMKQLFKMVGAMVNKLGTADIEPLVINNENQRIIRNLNFGESIIFLIIALLVYAVVVVCSFFMLYTVYFRFLRIMVIVPLGGIAFSTVSGNRTVSATAITYGRYVVGIILEAVAMSLAIIICNAFINGGLPKFSNNYKDWIKSLMYLCEMTFTVAMTVGFVRGAQQMVSRALGL